MLEATQFRDAEKYANYLKTASGRLRSDLAWENLRRFLPEPTNTRRVLDLGGGTGEMSVRLARRGFRAVLLDGSEEMLGIARMEAETNGVEPRISFLRGDACQLNELFEPKSFDIVVCHNVLEYVADPSAIVRSISYVLRNDGVFSLLVRNRAGEVLKAAIKLADYELAKENLSALTVMDSLYRQPSRIFDAAEVLQMTAKVNLDPVAEYGVRVFSDYQDSANPDAETYRQIFDLECALGTRREFAAIARYIQLIARRPGATEDSERGR